MSRDRDRDPAVLHAPTEADPRTLTAAEDDPSDADPEVHQDRSPTAVPDAPVGRQDPVDGTGYHDGAEQVPGEHDG